jgi:DNA gyrase/topoisomerase IV subunit A
MAITSAGQIVRMPVSQIRLTGRGAQGVRVVSFKEEGDSLVSVARVPPEESEGPEGEGGPAAPAVSVAAKEEGVPSSASAEAAPEETEGPGAEDAPSDGGEADEKPGDSSQ